MKKVGKPLSWISISSAIRPDPPNFFPSVRIGGFQKLSFIDFPDAIASVVFCQGCNWRCPWCHNRTLVYPEEYGPLLDEGELLAYLKRRNNQLDGVVISGGEPTLQPDLARFLAQVRNLDLKTKLDTNGSRPDVLGELLDRGLLDYVAMDLKAPLHRYDELTGIQSDQEALLRSIHILEQGSVQHQFRITLVPGMHTALDALEIAPLLRHPEALVIQAFEGSRCGPYKVSQQEMLQLERSFKSALASAFGSD